MKLTQKGTLDRTNSANASPATPRQPTPQQTLLSANFGIGTNGTRGAASLGRNLLSAGDRLRDLIIPDALASVVTAPAGWIPGIGAGATKRVGGEKDAAKIERMRKELEDVLAASCPLCESVVAGLDRPFVQPGEVDSSWTL